MKWFEAFYAEWVLKHRWWIIVASCLVLLTAASGMRFLSFNNDARVFFSEENPQLLALEQLENTYSKRDNVLFAIAPKDGNGFSRETLAAVEELTEASWQIPYSTRVDSVTNFQHTEVQEDDLFVGDLVLAARRLTDADLERIRKIATNEPLLVNRVISPSGDVLSVNANIILPGKSIDETNEIAAYSRKLVDEFRKKYPDIRIYLTGGIILDDAFGKISQDDMSTLVPAMLLVLLVMVGITLRSFTATFTTFIIIASSMCTALGIFGWFGLQLNAASVSAPTIILTLAVADSVHILATVFQQMRLGKNKDEAVHESLRINLHPVFFTSITTAIGFLTMNFSDAPPFRDLGNIVAVGVVAAFLYSVSFLPAMLAVLPVRIKAKVDPSGVICKPCENLANFVIRYQAHLFRSILVIIAILTVGISKIELNDNFIKYFSERYEVRRDTDFLEENLTGFDVIEYSLSSGESGGINRPDYLAKVEEFAEWYRKQPKAVHVITLAETVKRLNKNMHGDNSDFYRIPESRELAAQYLLLYEMSLPQGLDLNDQINVDRSSTRMTVTIKGSTAVELREMDRKARAWLKENAPQSMFTYGSGLSIMFAHISERNINSMLGASLVALVLISGILIFALRSIKLGVLSLIPNLAPAFMAFGIWGMAVGRVGLGLAVIVAMTLGIVVDDTVHFLSKYLRARRELGLHPSDAVRYSFSTVGTAMWITTLALVSGFMVLCLSGFKMNSDMGLMTSLTISIALAMDFFFLPTLLLKIDKKS